MKAKIEKLKERYVGAKTRQEFDAIERELRALCDNDAPAVADATLESIRDTNAELLRVKLNDVLPDGALLDISGRMGASTASVF